MGAWGFGPFQNDIALDFMGGVADSIARKTMRAKRPHEFLAGVHALSLLGPGGVIDEKTAKKMDKKLEALLKDKSFLDKWIDMEEIKKTIEGLRNELATMWY